MSDTLSTETLPQHDPQEETQAIEMPARAMRKAKGLLVEQNLYAALFNYLDAKPHAEVRPLIDALRNCYSIDCEVPA